MTLREMTLAERQDFLLKIQVDNPTATLAAVPTWICYHKIDDVILDGILGYGMTLEEARRDYLETWADRA